MRSDSTMRMYEYQATRAFSEAVRGSIKAQSKRDAKTVLKKHGLRFCKIWERGKTHWLDLDTKIGGTGFGAGCIQPHALTVGLDNSERRVYRYRSLWKFLYCPWFFIAAIVCIYCFARTMDVWWGFGAVFMVGLGLYIVLFKIELTIDKIDKQVRLRVATLREQRFSAAEIAKVAVARKLFSLSESLFRLYTTSLCLRENDMTYQLIASTDKNKEVDLGRRIAEAMGVPFEFEAAEE